MKDKKEITEHILTYRRVIFGVPVGFAAVAIIQYLQLSSLDKPLWISLYAFIVAMPLLSFGSVETSLIATIEPWIEDRPLSFLSLFNTTIGTNAFLVGATSLFWHFSWKAGILFLIIAYSTYLEFIYLRNIYIKKHEEKMILFNQQIRF